MKLALLVCVVALAGCASSGQAAQPVCPLAKLGPTTAPPPDDGYDALDDEHLVRKLLETTNSASLGKQVADSMMDTFRKMPSLPPRFVDRFKENLRPESLTELVVPIYLKHYDRKTILATLRFYKTDAGQRLLTVMPTVTAETMEAGKAWGTALAEKTMKDIGAP